MDTEFQETLKTRSDQELLKDISLGKDSFQDGYYAYFLNEANRRSLNYSIPTNQNSINTQFPAEDFLNYYTKNKFNIKSIGILKTLSLITVLSSILYLALFYIWQSIRLPNIVSSIYSTLLVLLLIPILIYPILKIIQLVNLYRFVKHISIITNSTFKVKPSDVILSIFIPIIGSFFSLWIIYSLTKQLEQLQSKTNELSFAKKSYTLIKSLAFSLIQIFSVYQIISDFNKVKTN